MNGKKYPGKRLLGFASVAVAAILLFCSIVALGQDTGNRDLSATDSEADMSSILLHFQADVQGSLTDLDSDVANAAQNLSTTGLEGDAAREVLSKLLETNSNLVEASTFSKEGQIIIAECRECKGSEGADISSQEVVANFLKNKVPILSKQLLLAEGYNGTVLECPVISQQGVFLGGTSAIIEPDKLLDRLASPRLHFNDSTQSNTSDYTFWVMDLDGLLLYDEDSSQIGRNLLEDPLYESFPSLQVLVEQRIMTERSGHGYYSFFQETRGNEAEVTKECYWTTAGLHGTEWRLVINKVVK
jgi:polar amino acid transport system substrate-binding protein